MQLRGQAASLLGSIFQLATGLAVVAATAPVALLVLPLLSCLYFRLQHDYRMSATEVQRLSSMSRSPILQEVVNKMWLKKTLTTLSTYLSHMIRLLGLGVNFRALNRSGFSGRGHS